MASRKYRPVLRARKLSSDAKIAGACQHNSRKKKPKNADPARAIANEILIGKGIPILDAVNTRLNKLGIIPRKNAVRAVEFIQSAGKQFFKNIKDRKEWIDDCLNFLRKKYGAENVVHATLHDDETTLHLHVVVVPIVRAKDRDGEFYKNHKDREWKLDAKGIFESLAHLRPLGLDDKGAAEFILADFKSGFRLIKKLVNKTDLFAEFLAEKIASADMALLSDPNQKMKVKGPVLVSALNKILAGPSVCHAQFFANQKPSDPTLELKDQNPTGDDLFRLNRKLIDDAYPKLIKKGGGRPVGNPTAPYMHLLQVEYYNLCKRLDPHISEPLYHTKAKHVDLSDYYSALKEANETAKDLYDIKIIPPSKLDILNPGNYVANVTKDVKEQTKLLVAAAADGFLARKEVEDLKDGIAAQNRSHERDKERLVAENMDFKQQNESLLQQLRTIPLDQVLIKLGYNQRVPGKENQFYLPDERIIEINGRSFTDLTSRYGLGQMSNRKSAKGAIDLTMFVTGWDLKTTQKWLKLNFDLGVAINESADRLKDELKAELEKNVTADESKAFTFQGRSPLLPDADQWIQVKQSLAVNYGLEPQLLDDLQRASLIAANKHGALVCIKLNQKQSVGGIALGLKANPLTGTTSVFETLDDDGFPFVLGNPQSQFSDIVASPLEAIAFYQLCRRNCYVLATKSALPPAIMHNLKQRDDASSFPVLIAHDLSPEGEDLAKQVKINLDNAGIKSEPHRPPKFHDHSKSWVDLILAVSGKLKKFAGISTEAVSEVVERYKNMFGIFSPSSTTHSIKHEK